MTKKQIAHEKNHTKTTAELQQNAKQLGQLVRSMTTRRESSLGGHNPPSYLRQMELAGEPVLIELYKLGAAVTFTNGQLVPQLEPVFTLAVSGSAAALPLAILKSGPNIATMQRWKGHEHDPYLERATPAQTIALDELWRRLPDITWLERGEVVPVMMLQVERSGLADSLLTRARGAVDTGAPPLSLPRFIDRPLPATVLGRRVEQVEQLALLKDRLYSITGFFEGSVPLLLEVLEWDNTKSASRSSADPSSGHLLERRTYSVAPASGPVRQLANAVADWRDAEETRLANT